MINLMFNAHDCDGDVCNVHNGILRLRSKDGAMSYMWLMLFVLVHKAKYLVLEIDFVPPTSSNS